ncbi:hypothetical protein [Salinicoccus albus]|uniref:hypothetical protein n=1 Tax=Salinicoccus albus TaxID=418756 RepID=UPI000360C1F9|nr:hypothetical protein [Salinicoccus albus]
MISYQLVNEYLDKIELPQSIEQVLSHQYTMADTELEFINNANDCLRKYESYKDYRLKDVHCMGSCLTNLTRVGLYFLLKNELIFVSTSNLKDSSMEDDWKITHYPFREIQELDMELMEGNEESKYNSGVLYMKLLNEKGSARTHVLRNFNPNHFQCFKEFHRDIISMDRL